MELQRRFFAVGSPLMPRAFSLPLFIVAAHGLFAVGEPKSPWALFLAVDQQSPLRDFAIGMPTHPKPLLATVNGFPFFEFCAIRIANNGVLVGLDFACIGELPAVHAARLGPGTRVVDYEDIAGPPNFVE